MTDTETYRDLRDALEWKRTVIDALIVNFIYRKEHEADPHLALAELLAWEQKIALDPRVSSDAEALVERGRAEIRVAHDAAKAYIAALEEHKDRIRDLAIKILNEWRGAYESAMRPLEFG